MRVCLDCQSAIGAYAGVGRYTCHLAAALDIALDLKDSTLCFFCFDFKGKGFPFPTVNARVRRCRCLPGRVAFALWRRAGFPAFDRFAGEADVYHFPNFYIPPLRRGKAVVTIHDVAFLRYPDTIEERNYRFLARHIPRTIERADAVLTGSEYVANELRDRFAVCRDKTFAVLNGIDPFFQPPTAPALRLMRAELGLSRPYLLHVGTLEPRKNLELLVSAFERLESFDGDLVLAGAVGWKCEALLKAIRESPRAARIRRLDYTPERHLCALYGAADAFVFPSHYEGFGFTPLEAMACGTPVLSSKGGSLPEVLGDAAVFADGANPAEWAAQIERLLTDSALRNALIPAGRTRSRDFTWEAAAQKVWQLYSRVAEHS